MINKLGSMINKLDIVLSSLAALVKLAVALVDEAPDKDEARKMLAARLRRMLDKSDMLDLLHAEDQAILDARIPPR
jgi:hypothetical protein